MKSITEVVQNLLKTYIDKNIETATGELGAKNLLPNNATTQLVHGIQYQVDSTGKITASGATDGENSWLTIADFSLAKGKYMLSGCPSGGSTSGYALAINFNGASVQYFDFGDGYEFELSETTTLLVRIRIADPTTLTTNKDFYPMIRPATVADATYVPYAKTNRQIVANDKAKTTITYSDSYVTIDNTYSGYVVKNGWVFWQFRFKTTDTAAHEVGVILPPNAFGNYIYADGQYTGSSQNENQIEIRINHLGIVRFRNYTETDSWVIVNGCYPMAE